MGEGVSKVDSEKYELILEAAADVFGKTGLHRTRIDDVAAAAGVGKGTIYLYFSSKEQLLESVLQRAILQYHDHLVAESNREGTTREVIGRMFRFTLDYAADNRPMMRVLLEGSLDLRAEFKQWLLEQQHQTLDLLVAVIGRGIEHGHVRLLQPEIAGRVLLGALNALAAFRISSTRTEDVEQLVRNATDVVWNGLSG